MNGSISRSGVLLLLLVVLLVAGFAFGRGRTMRPPAESAQDPPTATLDPTRFSDPIFDPQDAITRSLQAMSGEYTPTESHAVLLSVSALDAWRERSSPIVVGTDPAWLVGVRIAGIKVEDVLPTVYGDGYDTETAEMEVDGAWFAWNANSGAQLGYGVLDPTWGQNYASLTALAQEQLPIVAATEVVWPTATP